MLQIAKTIHGFPSTLPKRQFRARPMTMVVIKAARKTRQATKLGPAGGACQRVAGWIVAGYPPSYP